MASYGGYSFGMTFMFTYTLVQMQDMAVTQLVLLQYYRISRFSKSPLQITVYIRAYLAIVGLTPLELTLGTFPT
jgi:hypothetical protein